MQIRTDLALEESELQTHNKGINTITKRTADMTITRMDIKENSSVNREKGTYITCEFKALTDNFTAADARVCEIGDQIRSLIPREGTVLVAGIGNHNITPDAIGPKTASKILATRHIQGDIASSLGFEGLRSVCTLSPGVLGQTGIETGEMIEGIKSMTDISCIIAVDALASRRLYRLGCTVQISDTGIAPGSGVGNNRLALNRETMGVPVIGIGVPTVVDAATLAADLISPDNEEESDKLREMVYYNSRGMVVTPRDIDLLVERASTLIGMAINVALHPDISPEDIYALI